MPWPALLVAVAAVQPASAQTLPDPALLNRVLDAHLRNGLVDYRGLAGDRQDLDLYLAQLARTSPHDLELVSRDARLAFWINAYNACALALVLEHYPLPAEPGAPAGSVRHIKDASTRQFCSVAQRARSLDGIVHGIIRPLGDPRAHFAVACPSRSCPPLAGQAYRGEDLDAQLDVAVARFVSDTLRYQLVAGTPPTLHVNKFLDWYKEDFGGTSGVVALLRRFVPPEQASILVPGHVRVEYFAYDWALNDAAAADPGR
jgi:hypothetical protein